MVTILVEKWHLAVNGIITAWVSHEDHNSKQFATLKSCYTSKTNGIQLYKTPELGLTIPDRIAIEYEYSIPLIQLKQRKVKWQWQGVYSSLEDDVILEFNIEQHIQEHNAGQTQTLKEINDIIAKLNEIKYRPHNFRLSEGSVLCQHCGELLVDLKKKKKTDSLPPCVG